MKTYLSPPSRVIQYCFCIICLLHFCSSLFAQKEFEHPKRSIEINAAVLTGKSLSDINSNTIFLGFTDTVYYQSTSAIAPEVNLKYIHSFARDFAWYGGLFLGADVKRNSLILRDTIATFFGGFSSSNNQSEFFTASPQTIVYGALSGGIRVKATVFNNDAVNFSLGAKATFYPKQNLGYETSLTSNVRQGRVEIISTSSLQNQAKIIGSFEADLNYQFITKNERYKFIIGILFDRNNTRITSLNTDVVLENGNVYNREYAYQGVHAGAYLGFGYYLGASYFTEYE